jgi:hypothetical protein
MCIEGDLGRDKFQKTEEKVELQLEKGIIERKIT